MSTTIPSPTAADEGLLAALIGDGRALFKLFALALAGSGVFVLFQAATGHFLPQDTAFLGLDAEQLCAYFDCRVVHFMIHDRVSFGGVLLATAVMYLWLAEFPLKQGKAWAWWTLAISGGVGFLTFLAYLGYGYLDTWHGAATLALIPLYVLALMRTRVLRSQTERPLPIDLRSRAGRGRVLLLAATFGMIAAGLVIMTVGRPTVFVPQDLEFMHATASDIRAINAHLLPLIAHDRAGFGGALLSCGVAMFMTVIFARPSRSLWQALAIAGVFGFTAAIGVHPIIGYTNMTHLGPAIFGCFVFFVGLGLTWRV
ncbi:MAG: hypothetical protein ACXVJT_01580 [Thermoanaerobaculia bacterium]